MTSSNIEQHKCQKMTFRPTFALKKALILLIGSTVFTAHSAEGPHTSIQKLISESLGQPDNRVITEVGDYEARLEGCVSPKAFLPYPVNANGGRTTVGFHCSDDLPTRYVPVTVKVTGSYWVPSQDIPRGEVITQAMLTEKTGDLSRLPRNIVLDGETLLGMQSNRVLKASAPVQKTSLQAVFVVKRNAVVDVEAYGSGFTIKREGVAMDNGSMGASVRVKIKGGDTVRATVAGPHLLRIDI